MKKTLLSLFLLSFCILCIGPSFADTGVSNQQSTDHSPSNIDVFEEIRKEESAEKQSPDHFFHEFLNMLATLGLLVALILGASWFLKRMATSRMQQINANSTIKILEKRSLSPKAVVYVIEIHDKTFYVAETPSGITLLDKVSV